jgi:hypothetical protein
MWSNLLDPIETSRPKSIEPEVKPISDRQAVLFDLTEYECADAVKWGWLEEDPKLVTEKSLVTNSPAPKLVTEKSLVTNSPAPKLVTEKSSVTNSPAPKLVTEKSSVTNSPLSITETYLSPAPSFESTYIWEEKYEGKYLEDWKPKVGCLSPKWSKNHQYWCWRYYDCDGKKRSIHLHKDYNKAVRKAIKIGVPFDAKLPNLPASDPPPTAETN